jgi:hypothetical protein
MKQLQESVLSPPVLVFCHRILVYQCRSIIANIGSDFQTSIVPVPMDAHLMFPIEPSVSLSRDQLLDLTTLWHSILGDYSDRGISVPSGKEPAPPVQNMTVTEEE